MHARRAGAARAWCIVGGSALLLASGAAGSSQSDSLAAERVFTESQARRGQSTYSRSCEACHGADLRGDSAEEIPELASGEFSQRWEDRTLDDLFQKVRRTMPANAPGTLSETDAIDVVAYLLQANGASAGTGELTPDPERLGRLSVPAVLGAIR